MLLTIQDDANKSDYEYVLKGVGKASTVLVSLSEAIVTQK